jgi:hypothetical protein
MNSKNLISKLSSSNGDDIDIIYKNNEYKDCIEQSINVYWTLELEEHNDSISGFDFLIIQVDGIINFNDEDGNNIEIDVNTYSIIQVYDVDNISFPFCPKSLLINCDKEVVEVSFKYN